jgi:hypothetical protein
MAVAKFGSHEQGCGSRRLIGGLLDRSDKGTYVGTRRVSSPLLLSPAVSGREGVSAETSLPAVVPTVNRENHRLLKRAGMAAGRAGQHPPEAYLDTGQEAIKAISAARLVVTRTMSLILTKKSF